MYAVHWYRRILASPSLHGEPLAMVITLNGREFVNGPHYSFTNPCSEIGILFVRVLLEFTGFQWVKESGTIGPRKRKPTGTDVQIEDFSAGSTPLSAATIRDIVALGIADEQECINALVCAFRFAHKAVAHLTVGHEKSDEDIRRLVLSADITLAVLEKHFFGALGVPAPCLPIVHVPRSAPQPVKYSSLHS